MKSGEREGIGVTGDPRGQVQVTQAIRRRRNPSAPFTAHCYIYGAAKRAFHEQGPLAILATWRFAGAPDGYLPARSAAEPRSRLSPSRPGARRATASTK